MSDSFFFSGSEKTNLDDKNRFVIPQTMRYGLIEEGKLEFAIGLGMGGCLAIYRRCDIQKIVTACKRKIHQAKLQHFLTLFFSTLHHTSCDRIGRVVLPGRLKEIVKVQKEIILAGVLDKIEIWPKEQYEKRVLTSFAEQEEGLSQMMEEAFSLLHGGEDEGG